MADRTVTLNIFDFDGTLFKSPVPNPKTIDKGLVGKLKATTDQGGLGWFQDIITLSEPFVPLVPSDDWFAPAIKAEVLASMQDPKAVTVLLTGRSKAYQEILERIVNAGGLKFDAIGLKPTSDEKTVSTMDFKQEFIRELIENYRPAKIRIWEDRPEHTAKFTQFFRQSSFSAIQADVIQVEPAETYLSDELEQELLLQLKARSGCQVEFSHTVSYTGVFLDDESVAILKGKFPPIDGWKQFYHHMTICLGPLKEVVETGSHLPSKEALGKHVTLKVVGVGRDDRAYAAQVEGFPSFNSIPHITMCVAPNRFPKDSNSIREWSDVSEPFQVQGIVKESRITQAQSTPSRNAAGSGARKIPLAALLKEHTTKSGRELGDAMKELTTWMSKMKLDNVEQNSPAVIAHIKSTMS